MFVNLGRKCPSRGHLNRGLPSTLRRPTTVNISSQIRGDLGEAIHLARFVWVPTIPGRKYFNIHTVNKLTQPRRISNSFLRQLHHQEQRRLSLHQNQPPPYPPPYPYQQVQIPIGYPQHQYNYGRPHPFPSPPPPPPPPRRKGPWLIGLLIASGCLSILYKYREPMSDFASRILHEYGGWGVDVQLLDPDEFRCFKIISREPLRHDSDIQIIRVRPDPMPASFYESPVDNYGDAWRNGLWHVEIKHPDIQVSREYTPLPPVIEDSYHIQESSKCLEDFATKAAMARHDPLTDNLNPADPVDLDEMIEKLAVDPAGQKIVASMFYPESLRCDLLFAIRPLSDGLVSRYLCSLPIGSPVYLRGPHYDFHTVRRSGLMTEMTSIDEIEARGEKQASNDKVHVPGEELDEVRVVCVAGGTGIVPAMQALFPVHSGLYLSPAMRFQASVLWATRQKGEGGFDMAREAHGKGNIIEYNDEHLHLYENSIVRWFNDLIFMLKAEHPDRQQISLRYFSDEDQERISANDIERALLEKSAHWETPRSMPQTNPYCHYHSRLVLAQSPESDPLEATCGCVLSKENPPRKHVLVVSGPPGFVDRIAGPKYWSNGRQLQGRIGGVLAELEEKNPGILDDWLVLKL